MQGDFSSNQANTPAVTATGTNGAEGIHVVSDGTAIQAQSDHRYAVVASTETGIAVVANAVGAGGIGIRATSDSFYGVSAQTKSGIAVRATSDSNYGVLGECLGNSFGVVGQAPNAGVAAFNPNNDHAAYLASDCCAAWFTGQVHIGGLLMKSGGGFRIDHPLHPDDQYLSHSFVESPDMKNVYDGTVIADSSGKAVVELPDWFEAVNHEFRYQLTPLGGPAPDLHVAQEIQGNRFTLAGAGPGMKVCWQLTGIRHDAWARANRIEVEEAKDLEERGRYLHPQLYGVPEHESIGQSRHPRPQHLSEIRRPEEAGG